MQALIEVFWVQDNPAYEGDWMVNARTDSSSDDWSSFLGDNLDELLSIAHDVATGG